MGLIQKKRTPFGGDKGKGAAGFFGLDKKLPETKGALAAIDGAKRKIRTEVNEKKAPRRRGCGCGW